MNYICGISPILEMLRAGKRNVHKILILKGTHSNRLDEIRTLARKKNIICQEADNKQIDQIAGNNNHQGVVAIVEPRSYLDAEDIIYSVPKHSALFVLLDQIEDPHNLGAIIRTAECAGVQAVIFTEHSSAKITEVVVKTSAGATEYIPIACVTNLVNLIKKLKSENIWIVGTDTDAQQLYTEWDYTLPTAIVLGNEGKGLRRLVRESCDIIVSIPLAGKISSLNVSVAAGVVLYEAIRQRHQKT